MLSAAFWGLSNVTLWIFGPGNVQVTLPLTAILTVSGLKVWPAPLAVTSAVLPSADTFGVEVAVLVVPPEVRVAVTVEPPGSRATTRPVAETDTDVPVVSAKLAGGRPAIAAPFWSRGVALSCNVSPSTRAGFAGDTVSAVNTVCGGGCVPPSPPPPHAERMMASARVVKATLCIRSPIRRSRQGQRAKLSHR